MSEKSIALKKVVADLGTAKFDAPEIGVDEVITRLEAKDENLVLLDARSLEEREVGIIPGSINLDDFNANPSAYADKDVVCYCTVGYIR